MKWRRWTILVAALVLTIFGGCFFVLRHLRVPYNRFQATGLSSDWRGEGYKTINPNPTLSNMVARAKFDHLVSPIPGLRGGIVFEEARSKGDEIYLLFRPANVSGTMI